MDETKSGVRLRYSTFIHVHTVVKFGWPSHKVKYIPYTGHCTGVEY